MAVCGYLRDRKRGRVQRSSSDYAPPRHLARWTLVSSYLYLFLSHSAHDLTSAFPFNQPALPGLQSKSTTPFRLRECRSDPTHTLARFWPGEKEAQHTPRIRTVHYPQLSNQQVCKKRIRPSLIEPLISDHPASFPPIHIPLNVTRVQLICPSSAFNLPMSSATYIPLTRLSSSDYFPAPQFSPHAPFTSYFSRRRAVLALIAATSVVTLVLFLKTSNAHEDDFDYDGIPLNPSYHPSYIAIPVPNSLPPSSQPKLRPVRDLPLYCLDRYYALGGTCHDGSGPVPLDIVWTWVNGSDPLFSDARQKAAQSYDHDDPYRPIKSNNPSRMFR